MKFSFLLILLLPVVILFSQPEIIYTVDQQGNLKRHKLVFNDEFNEKILDRSKWRTSYPWGQNYAGTCYQELMTDGQNLELSNGILKMEIKKEQVYTKGVGYESDTFKLQDGKDNLRIWNYTSGMIFSNQQFRKGIFEVKFKLPDGQGFWPAFWLFAGQPNEEFDIFEVKGENNHRVHYDMHCPNGDCRGFGNWLEMNHSFSTGFNTMSGEWNENTAFWYLNGKQIAAWYGHLRHPANIIANLGLANNAPCAFSPGENEQTPFPSVFEVDYIRVYQESEIAHTINYKKKSGKTKYTLEHGSSVVKKTGSDNRKNLRKMSRKKEAITIGHIRLYKDEVLNQLVFQLDDRSKTRTYTVVIYDANNNKIREEVITGTKTYAPSISLKNLTEGMYLIKISSGVNEIVEYLRVS